MRVILSGGGTAGHVNPAIAIAKHIKAIEPESEILFVGTERGIEKNLVPREGFNIKFIEVEGLKRKLTLRNVSVLYKAVRAYRDSKKIIKAFKPDVVIGTSGYVCAPVLYAAHKSGIPVVLHEQNVFPGLVVRSLSKYADVTAISFEETKDYIKNAKKVVLTGNPIRQAILDMAKNEKRMGEPKVLIYGGSLGADSINRAVLELLSLPGQEYYGIVVSTGERNFKRFKENMKELHITLSNNKVICPYIYNMDEELANADIAITRAGAITLSELCAIGKPSIIIPSPNVVNNHQTYNARYMEKIGASVVIPEDELCGKILAEQIKTLISNKETLKKMSESARKIGITTACEQIYGIAKELIGRR